MPPATHDTMHGATVALSANSIALRVVDISATKSTIPDVPTSHHGTTTNGTKMPGDLADLAAITIQYQNSPGLANPTKGTVQTLTITGPLSAGSATGEIMSITGFVTEVEDSPQYTTSTGTSAALQVKSFTFMPDGTTYSRTASA